MLAEKMRGKNGEMNDTEFWALAGGCLLSWTASIADTSLQSQDSSLPTFTFDTTAEEVATVFAEEIRGKNGEMYDTEFWLPDVHLETVLITGTSMNGLGFEAALQISKYANLVVITGYNDERYAKAVYG